MVSRRPTDIQYCEIKEDKSSKYHASDHESLGPVFAFAAASSSLKDPLRRHIPENTTNPVNEIPGRIKFRNLSVVHDKSLELWLPKTK